MEEELLLEREVILEELEELLLLEEELDNVMQICLKESGTLPAGHGTQSV